MCSVWMHKICTPVRVKASRDSILTPSFIGWGGRTYGRERGCGRDSAAGGLPCGVSALARASTAWALAVSRAEWQRGLVHIAIEWGCWRHRFVRPSCKIRWLLSLWLEDLSSHNNQSVPVLGLFLSVLRALGSGPVGLLMVMYDRTFELAAFTSLSALVIPGWTFILPKTWSFKLPVDPCDCPLTEFRGFIHLIWLWPMSIRFTSSSSKRGIFSWDSIASSFSWGASELLCYDRTDILDEIPEQM